MKDRNANSYNLQYAQQILATLVPRPRPDRAAVSSGHTFVRLPQEKRERPASQAPTKPLTESEIAPADTPKPPPGNFRDWEECISWCIETTRAEAAFVVDSQGFIIATRGRIPSHGFECTGAELIYSMDQLERIDPEAGKLLWIDLDFNKRRLVGFVTPKEEEAYFIVGLIAPDVSYNGCKQLISKHVIDNLGNMN